MKKASMLIGIFAILFSSISIAQTSKEVVFIFKKGDNDKILHKNAAEQKFCDFEVSGLDKPADVIALVAKAKKIDGVIEFTVSPNLNSKNNRDAHLLLFQRANKEFVKKLFLTIGINNVIVDGKKIPTAKLGEKPAGK
jgi:uncharacterized protein YwqG